MVASGPTNERMSYDQDKVLCIGTVMIERMLREREKENIIVLAHIERPELYPANPEGHMAELPLHGLVLANLCDQQRQGYIRLKHKVEDRSLTDEDRMGF